jgi:hypothetical protein
MSQPGTRQYYVERAQQERDMAAKAADPAAVASHHALALLLDKMATSTSQGRRR